MDVSAKTAAPERKDALGPVVCQQCRKLVRWVRTEGTLRLVNDASGAPHCCLSGC